MLAPDAVISNQAQRIILYNLIDALVKAGIKKAASSKEYVHRLRGKNSQSNAVDRRTRD